MPGKFPAPYINDVPAEASDGMMEYPPMDKMGIGARPSGLPSGDKVGNLKGIDHVGGSSGESGKRGGSNK